MTRRSPGTIAHRTSPMLVLLLILAALAATPASAATAFTNQTPIAIPSSGSSGPAAPYPSEIAVSGLGGPITGVVVTLHGFGHTLPGDVDILLVSPGGDDVMLMSDACGTFDVNAFGWMWDDEAAAPMPDGGDTNVCSARVHRPTDHEPGENWEEPAPARPYGTTLSAFDGTDPNGEWRLFVMDDSSGEVGFFTNRFQLQIQTNTKPTITNVEPAPGSKTRARTPLIAATVLDTQTELAEANIRLFVDGKARSFSYNATTDRLVHQSKKLKAGGRHTVRIVANDGALNTTRSWSFKVIQRR